MRWVSASCEAMSRQWSRMLQHGWPRRELLALGRGFGSAYPSAEGRSDTQVLYGSDLQPQHLRRGATQYRDLVDLTEVRRVHDVVDCRAGPGIGIIRAQHEATRTEFGN